MAVLRWRFSDTGADTGNPASVRFRRGKPPSELNAQAPGAWAAGRAHLAMRSPGRRVLRRREADGGTNACGFRMRTAEDGADGGLAMPWCRLRDAIFGGAASEWGWLVTPARAPRAQCRAWSASPSGAAGTSDASNTSEHYMHDIISTLSFSHAPRKAHTPTTGAIGPPRIGLEMRNGEIQPCRASASCRTSEGSA